MRTSVAIFLCWGGGRGIEGGGDLSLGGWEGKTLWEQTMGACSSKKVSDHTNVGALKAVPGRKSKEENATHSRDAAT